jgi:D-alanyl-D-alanine carboxypeptidase (penicillin-binding protein 5/6)
MKKRYSVLCSLMVVGVAFGARAPITPISNTPYTGAIVVDVATGEVLFEDAADKPVYPASVVKLMDLLLTLELIDRGEMTLASTVRVTAEAARMGGSQVYLKEGEVFTLDEMLFALSIKSANDVAVAIATHVAGSKAGFVTRMNQRAAELGMMATQFESVHGLPPDTGQKPDVTTARDISRLALEIVKLPKAIEYTSTQEKWFRNNTFQLLSHNRLLKSVEGCDGLKTGYYRAAGFSIAATAERNGRRVIAVVMGCQSRPVRDEKTRELLEQAFMNLPALPASRPQAIATMENSITPITTKGEGSQELAQSKSKLKSFLTAIQKVLLVLLIIVLAGGGLIVALYGINRYRDRWKYKL